MWKTLVGWSLMGVFLAFWEQVLRTFLGSPLVFFLPVLPMAVFSIIRGRRFEVLAAMLAAGLVVDLFPQNDAHVAMVIAGFVFFSLVVSADRVMTNHSLYSAVALVVVARVLAFVLQIPIEFVRHGSAGVGHLFQWSELWPIFLWDSGCVLLLFVGEGVLKRIFIRSNGIRPSYGD